MKTVPARRYSQPFASLPFELIENIIGFLPHNKLSTMMRVSKRWNKTTKKILYKNIKFTSVKQREMFFKCLHSADHGILSTISVSPKRSLSPRRRSNISELDDLDLVSPPRVILPRKCSLRSHVVSQTAELIESLDFGLQPKLLKQNEPELPCSKQILASPAQISATSDILPSSPFDHERIETPISLSSISALRRGFHIPAGQSGPKISQWQGRWDLRSNSIIENSNRSTSIEDNDENQIQLSPLKSEEISPIKSPRRERPIPSTLSLNEPTSPYGSWSHRFVSPFLSMITQNIPHLKKLSLCGCHVNGNDFIVMIELLTSLEVLDISYSTLKNNSLEAISRYCRYRLKLLDVSGIFKLGRNRAQTLVLISAYCERLEKIIALDCPEIFEDNLAECQKICDNKIEYVVDHE